MAALTAARAAGARLAACHARPTRLVAAPSCRRLSVVASGKR